MNIFLEVTRGTQHGQRFLIKNGTKIGSSSNPTDVDIRIIGNKVAPTHAKVMLDDKNQFVLVCTNIIYDLTVNSRSVKKVVLIPGIVFFIEEVQFKVVEFESVPDDATIALVENQQPLPENDQLKLSKKIEVSNLNKKLTQNKIINFEPSKEIDSNPQFFNDEDSKSTKLQKLLISALDESIRYLPNRIMESKVRPLQKMIKLVFQQGIQYEKEYFLGWGPRRVGKGTLEFQIEEPTCPNEAFIVYPARTGETVFITKFPELVSLNGQNTPKEILRHGDKIKIGDTIIQVFEIEN